MANLQKQVESYKIHELLVAADGQLVIYTCIRCYLGKEYEGKYKLALQLLSSQHLSLQNHETEFSVVQNIKKLLGTKERYQDARKFDELYARLTVSVGQD